MDNIYHITGMTKATISKDRSTFEIGFKTNRGDLVLTVSSEHLDSLITTLQGLEYNASLLDPVTGQKPGEQGQIRAAIVDNYHVGNAVVNGVPSVLIGLKSVQALRWFALDKETAIALSDGLKAETGKIQSEPKSH